MQRDQRKLRIEGSSKLQELWKSEVTWFFESVNRKSLKCPVYTFRARKLSKRSLQIILKKNRGSYLNLTIFFMGVAYKTTNQDDGMTA